MELLLTENTTSRVSLKEEHIQGLVQFVPELTVAPAWGQRDTYDVTPGQRVGLVQVGDLFVEIRPKIPMPSMLFMLAYALDARHWRDLFAAFQSEAGLLDAIAVVFGRELSRAFQRGLLRGYTARRESLPVVRGRVMIAEQVRRWYGRVPPVECGYDEFTEDILENRLLKAALGALHRLKVRNPQARTQLSHADAQLENVTGVHFQPQSVPTISYHRLNERFRRAIELARLILGSSSLLVGRKGVSGSAFLVDLAGVFETFVLTALRESPGLAPWSVPQRKQHAFLDVAGRLRLIPDLAFHHEGQIVAVGDIKYKRTPPIGVQHPDAYQVLAYAVAFGLSNAFLVYPREGHEHGPTSHVIRNADISLHVFALDLNTSPMGLLDVVNATAGAIRSLGRPAAA